MVVGNRSRAVASWAAAFALVSLPALGQQLFVYPSKGQSNEQLSNDRYECHQWAVKETGFDPTAVGETAPPPVVRVPVPENKAAGATAKGAVAGAIAGAVLGHKDAGENAVLGAVVGSIAGAAVEQSGEADAQEKARAEAQRQAHEIQQSKAERALQRSNYRRAIAACLEGRGYTVK
jgi:outer membrane lipoprotein SlyB